MFNARSKLNSVIKKLFRLKNLFHKSEQYRIILDAPYKFHFFHMSPIIEQLKQDKRIKLIAVKWNDFSEEDIEPGFSYIDYNDFQEHWFQPYDVYLTSEYNRKPYWLEDCVNICMFHGAGPKMSYIKNPAINRFDVLFSVGPQTFSVQTDYVDKGTSVEKVGLPALDAVIRRANNSRDEPTIKFKRTLKTILYAPSWTANADHLSINDEILQEIAKLKEYNIIIRPHPHLLKPDICDGIDWHQKILDISCERIKVSYSSDHSVYDILDQCDMLLGDISSVTYEFLPLNKPIILYMKPGVLEHYDAVDFIEPLQKATHQLETASDLTMTVDNALEETQEKVHHRQTLMHETFFNIGNASVPARDAIFKHLNI